MSCSLEQWCWLVVDQWEDDLPISKGLVGLQTVDLLFLISPDDFRTKVASQWLNHYVSSFRIVVWTRSITNMVFNLKQLTLCLYKTSDNNELFSNLKNAISISRDFLKVLLYNLFDTFGFDKFFRALYFTSFPRRHNLTTFLNHFEFTKKWSCNLPL